MLMEGSHPLLRFENIRFRYHARAPLALDLAHFEIQPGSATAILGPNGAGKTTLLYLALGWLRPESGQIFLNERPLEGFTRRALGQCMALVPQTEHIPFEYSLLEYVLLGRSPYLNPLDMPGEKDIQVAGKALEKVGLGQMRHRSILHLSGGERQLAMMARALAQQPRLLLLDEPTAHLDLGNKARLADLLRQLNAQGVTILLNTHDPDLVSSFATHVALFRSGGILQTGTLEQVFKSASLSSLYQTPLTVREIEGKRLVIWN